MADLRGARGTRAPPGVQILSISCSFWGNLAKSYVGAPPGSWRPLLGKILDPPLVINHVHIQNSSSSNTINSTRIQNRKTQMTKGLFTPTDSISATIILTGGTFDLFDGHCDGQNAHFLPINVRFVTVTVV